MNIVLIGTAWPYRGGLAAFNERLIGAFNEEGHTGSIVTFTLQYPNLFFPGKTQFSTSPAPQQLSIQRKVNSIAPWNWYAVGKAIQKQKPDIIIIKYWTPFMAPCFGTIARIIRKNKHTQVICIADNIIPHERHFWDAWLTKYFLGSIDACVVMSNTVLQDLALFDRKKLRALNPHPLFDNFGEAVSKEEACAFLKLDPGKNYLLFFGFIRDYKGLDVLLEAFDQVQHDCELIIAGEFYADRTAYDDQIAKMRKRDQVHRFHNFIPDGAVKYFFCAADAVVQPYKHATQSGVTQIAYHFHVPMIVTNIGGLAELVPNKVVGLVTEVQPDKIAAAIDTLYTEGNLQKFRENIQLEKNRFSWSRMTETIIGLYKRLR